MDTQTSRTVLVVDDDDGVMSILSFTMAHQGWHVLSADNGEHALATWQKQAAEIDLLITDVHMPEINGCELAKKIRADQPSLPIIFVSGDSGSDLALSVQTFPNHRYLKKPFRTSELVDMVSSFIK